MPRVCDYDLYVQIFADADATVAGIHKCMVDYMKLAPFRSGSVLLARDTIFSTRLRTYLMNAWADDDATANYETSWMTTRAPLILI